MLSKLFRKETYEPFDQSAVAEPQPQLQEQPVATVTQLVPVRSAPGTSIRYNPELVAKFEAEHAELRNALDSIKAHAEKGEFTDAQQDLQAFRRTLTTHVLEENIKMYTYVSKCLAHDLGTKASMMAMKSEMDPVGTTALRLANDYLKSGITPFNKAQFLGELEDVARALVDRMDWEESSLFTMYLPPEAYE